MKHTCTLHRVYAKALRPCLLLLLILLAPAYSWAAGTIKLEAEAATLTGVNTATDIAGYSGTGYAWGFDSPTDNVRFTFAAPAGQYDLIIQYTSPYGDKGYSLTVNGVSADKTFSGSLSGFSSTTAGRYTLAEGQNTVQITNGWGYYGIDYIALVPVSATPAPVVPVVNGRLEAEAGVLSGLAVATTPPGFSGTGVVTGFDAGTDKISLTFNMATGGLYKVGLGYNAPYGDKGFDLSINDETANGMLTGNGSSYGEVNAGSFLLKAGLNTIVVNNGWGYYNVDYVQLTPTTVALPAAVPATLVDAKATPATKALFRYLRSLYGSKVLAGQHAGPEDKLGDIQYIIDKTGKEPALGSFDLIEYSPSRVEHGSNPKGNAEQYLAWAKKDQGRGIVSLMWHWNAPTDLLDTATEPWWKGFYTEGTTFDIAAVMADTTGSRYKLLQRDIDSIAVQLKKFQAANIPVLWRPLHEAPGAFFWWGAKGPGPYKALWKMLYNRLTNYHQLHNLIWVYAGTQNPPIEWYPGDGLVDIAGVDLYVDPSANMSGDWNGQQAQHGGKKLVALTESGNLPDPDKIRAFATWWSWFTIWQGTDYIKKQPLDYLQRVYTDADIITRDELADWRTLFAPLAVTTTKQDVSCPGGTNGSITATFGDGQSTYQVKLGATSPYSAQASPFTFANLAAGTYTVYVKNTLGVEVSQTVTLAVTGIAPVPSIAVSRTDQTPTGGEANTVYLGYGAQQLTLTASDASAATSTTYSWSPATDLSNASSPTPLFAPTKAGTYTYTLTATSNTGCTATKTVTLKVIDVRCGHLNQEVTVCHKGKALCVASAAIAAHLNHGDVLGDCTPNPTLATRAQADYQLAQAPVFEAYPNPFAERAVLHFRAASSGAAQVQLYNVLGQVVANLYSGTIEAGQDYEVAVDGTSLAAGLYTGRLVVNGKAQTVRLSLDKKLK